MKKTLSLCLASLAVVWAMAGSARSAVNTPPASTSGVGTDHTGQDEKKLPQKAEPDGGARGGAARKKDLVRGREHEKAAKAAFELGVKYGRAGRYEEAVGAFEDAVLYNPEHADAQFGLGHALYDLGRWAGAAEAFKRAAAIDQKDSEAFNYLGAAYFRQGLYDKAIEAYKEALILNPDLTDARYNAANAFYKLGRYEPAIRYYKDAIQFRPKSAELFNDMGVAYAEWGRYGEATEAFKRATKHDADDAYAHNNLALSYYFQGQYEEAVKAFERAARLAPYDAAIRRNADIASADANTGGAAVGDRVSLLANAGAGGGRRDVRWMGRSGVIHGIEESAPPAGAGTGADSASHSATPVKSDPAPRPDLRAGREAAAPPAAATPSASSESPLVVTSGRSTPGEETGVGPNKSGPPVPGPAPAAAAAVMPTDIYRVGVGDVLDIRLLDGRASNSTLYAVQAGGLVEYPPLGDPFAAAGKTADEIAAHIKSELKRRAVPGDAPVVVGVRDYASHTVIVSGLVGEPGAKVLRREAVPLYVVIADAQPLPEAGRVLITSDAGRRKTEVALDDQALSSTLVRPGDVISVLGKQQRFYFIAGKVEAPGQKDFHPGITLTQAILAAGGTLHESKTALVTRQASNGLLSASKYDLKEIMAGGAPDPALHPGDRIEVIR